MQNHIESQTKPIESIHVDIQPTIHNKYFGTSRTVSFKLNMYYNHQVVPPRDFVCLFLYFKLATHSKTLVFINHFA